ncbi:MAG: hypothetical protein JW915_01290 [Chitinispirillaceae bacterium]|nr:hypothetical protein [Chitinispirillaceae bacterium]
MKTEVFGLLSAIVILLFVMASFLVIPVALAWITGTDGTGAVFFFIFLILLFVCQSMYFGAKIVRWPSVDGIIIENEYVVHKSKTNASLHLQYQYSVYGKEYTNNTISLTERRDWQLAISKRCCSLFQ